MLTDNPLREELLQLRDLRAANPLAPPNREWVNRCAHLYETYGRETVEAEIDNIMKEQTC